MARSKVHPRTARMVLTGAVATVVTGLIVYYSLIANSLGGLPGTPHSYVDAEFADVGPLSVNDDVRQNSVRIGQVSAIRFDHGQAIVTMQLEGGRKVYRDATAAVWDQSALAVKFVELDSGTPAAGPLGNAPIAGGRTQSSQSLDQLLDVLDTPTRNALGSSVRQLGEGVAGHGQDLHAVLGNAAPLLNDLGRLSGAAADPGTDLPQLLQTADRLAGRFQGMQDRIAGLVEQTGSTLDAVNVDGGKPLGDTLKGLPPALTDVRGALTALDRPLQDTHAALATLEPGAVALGQATPDLRGFLREAVPPVTKIPGVSSAASPAVTSLTKTFADARPLVPQVNRALSTALTPLSVLAPYSQSIRDLFSNSGALSHIGDKYFFRINAAFPYPLSEAVAGEVLPTLPTDPYPEPGQSLKDRDHAPPLGIGLLGGGQ